MAALLLQEMRSSTLVDTRKQYSLEMQRLDEQLIIIHIIKFLLQVWKPFLYLQHLCTIFVIPEECNLFDILNKLIELIK